MFKSARRDKTEGLIDRVSGRVLELVAAVTGRKSTKAKGKATRTRGFARTKRGQTKRAAR